MFEMFTKKITKQVIDQAKDIVKEDVKSKTEDFLPLVIGVCAIAAFLFTTRDSKQVIQNITIIHNHYYK
jgi:hypothetical protein